MLLGLSIEFDLESLMTIVEIQNTAVLLLCSDRYAATVQQWRILKIWIYDHYHIFSVHFRARFSIWFQTSIASFLAPRSKNLIMRHIPGGKKEQAILFTE